MKTGDKVQWNEDKELVFLGRTDQQVKIRGYRIELGEVEARISLLPYIYEAVVIANKDVSDNAFLVAYYRGSEVTESGKIKVALKQWLPDYMIPSYFVRVESFPLTPNKKVDRKALAMQYNSFEVSEEYVVPNSENEKRVAQLWQNVLLVDKISIRTNFFDAGGHSLNASILASRIQHEFGIKFTITHVFEYPTIEEQANTLENIFLFSATSEVSNEDELESFTV